MLDLARREAELANGPRSYAEEIPDGMHEATDRIVDMLGHLQSELGVASKQLTLGGFSQGSMLACNAVFTRNVSPARLVVLSGTPLHLSAWKEGMRKREALRVFQSHGDRDPLLSFDAAEELRDSMRAAGLEVDWVPFRGGHEIPMPVLDAVGRFLTG